MSISQNFPNTRPSLNLNFARSKTLDPRITFIRTQTGNEASYVDESGIIRYSSADEPRFDHDPATGECLGLIIEEQRTNLCFYGTTIENFAARSGGIKTANATTAPDGTTTATRLQGDGTTTPYFDDNSNRQYVAGTTYTFSCFFKANGTDEVYILIYGTNWNGSGGTNVVGHFDLTTGDPIAASAGGEREPTGGVKMKPYPNGWYRCSITETCATTHNANHQLIRGVGFSADIYAWGYQIDADKDISSLIPTTTNQTVTRNSDNVWMDDITDFFNPNEGTAIITYRPTFDGVYNTPFQALFAIKNTTTGRSIGFDGNSNAGQLYFDDYTNLLQDNNGRFTWLDLPSPSTQRSERVLVSYANTYFRMYQNDIAFVSTNTLYGRGKISEYIPSAVGISTLGFNALTFGSGSTSNTNTKFNHIIQQFVYYPSEVGVSNARTLSKRP